MTTMEQTYQQGFQVTKHSGLGIASFVLAMMIGLFEFVLIVFAGIMETMTPGGMDEESLAGLAGNLAGVGLGIAGLVQRQRKKVFSTLGLIFNGGIIFGIIFLLILGSMVA